MAWKDKRGFLNPNSSDDQTGEAGGEAGNPNPKPEGDKEDERVREILSNVLVDDERGLQRRHFVDTTLLLHFFGPKGKREIRYEDFKK